MTADKMIILMWPVDVPFASALGWSALFTPGADALRIHALTLLAPTCIAYDATFQREAFCSVSGCSAGQQDDIICAGVHIFFAHDFCIDVLSSLKLGTFSRTP